MIYEFRFCCKNEAEDSDMSEASSIQYCLEEEVEEDKEVQQEAAEETRMHCYRCGEFITISELRNHECESKIQTPIVR